MKNFTVNNVTYSKRQSLGNGIQYQAQYNDGTTAWAFISGKTHTRQQVIDAIDEVNNRVETDDRN